MIFGSRRSSDINESALIDNIIVLTGYLEDLKVNLDCVGDARKLLLSYQLHQTKLHNSSDADIKDLETDYDREAALSQLIDVEIKLTKSIASDNYDNVTLDTLRATRSVDGKNTMFTLTGGYLMSLWTMMFVFMAIAIYFKFQIETFVDFTPIGDHVESAQTNKIILIHAINPFVFGTLGACVYLMRITSTKLHNRTFNPSRIPEHFNRLFLGTVSGGVIIVFLENTIWLGNSENGVPLTAAGIGFIAGYSIEFLYQIIDRIIKAVLPTISSSFDPKQVEIRKRKMLKDRYEKDLLKAKNIGSSKEIIELLEQLIIDLS